VREDATPAQRWFALALEDLAAARVLVADGSVALRIVGFLSQQAVEKALKAGLFAASLPALKIHGLQQLHGCYLPGDAPRRRGRSRCARPMGDRRALRRRPPPNSPQPRPRSFS
jgi:hypothetical protein